MDSINIIAQVYSMSIIASEIKYHSNMLEPYPWLDYHEQYDLILIIPASNEPDLLTTIASLEDCQYDTDYAVVLLINESEQCTGEQSRVNRQSYEQVTNYQLRSSHLHLYVFYVVGIESKKAGVGMARRLAMDQAVFLAVNDQTPIVNLDADCKVNDSYLSAIYKYAANQPKVELINIHYEHPHDHEAIIQYELHLRYFIEVQRYIRLPYAYHTVGSSFAVRVGAYVQVGRMNLRKAGEDFYFIHKFTKKRTLGECPTAVVIPSSRSSDRVPFGTGRAMIQMSGHDEYLSYNLESFIDLQPFLSDVISLYNALPTSLADKLKVLPFAAQDYFSSVSFVQTMQKLSKNAKSVDTFEKAFYQWFDAFKLMKYLHFMRDQGYEDQPVAGEASKLLRILDEDDYNTSGQRLNQYRTMQKAID